MKNGTRVKCEFGEGTVVSNEEYFGRYRYEVQLDRPEKWAFSGWSKKGPFFREDELTVLTEQQSPAP